jgi:hypothetical protein
VRQRGSSFVLPPGAGARIDCGQTSFFVGATTCPRPLPTPLAAWRWSEQMYTAGAAAALGLFLLMLFSVPADARSLSIDVLDRDSRFLPFNYKPPVPQDEPLPDFLQKSTGAQGGTGTRHKLDEGKMGDKAAPKQNKLYAIKGPKDNRDLHLAKTQAIEAAANAGILGVLKRDPRGGVLASIFGRDEALGKDVADVLGGLVGNEIGAAYGVGGLGVLGTGAGGGGTGEGTVGTGHLGTIGKGGGRGDRAGYGDGMGGLRTRQARPPDILMGHATVRGSLDKEIIRRIIRKHVNEVKFCYEQELTKKPSLAGRIQVQFAINGAGQVISSVMQSSTMGNARVEGCVVQAVKRWPFPQPLGGGLVIVSYPFVLAPAGAGV